MNLIAFRFNDLAVLFLSFSKSRDLLFNPMYHHQLTSMLGAKGRKIMS